MADRAAVADGPVVGAPGARGGAHESDRLRDAISERFLHIRSLRFETRFLLGAVVAQLIVAAILVFERNAHLPRIVSDNFAGTTATISILVLVFSVVFACVAWGLLLAGTYRSGWAVRAAVLAIFLWAMWAERDALAGVSRLTQGITIALIALVIVLAVTTWFPEHRGHFWDDPKAEATGRWGLVRRLLPAVMILVVGGIYLTVWLGNKAAGQVDVFSDDFADQLYNIELFLIPVLVLAGSDFGDWANFSVGRLGRRILNSTGQWAFAGVTIAAAGLILWDGLRTATADAGGGIREELLLGGAVLLGAILVYLVAKPRDHWPHHLPFAVLAIVAGADSLVAYIAQRRLGSDDPLFDSKVSGVTATFWLIVGAITLVALVALRKRLSGRLVAAGCFLVIIGLIDALTGLEDIGTVIHPFGLHSTGTVQDFVSNAPYLGVEGLKAVAAIVTILLVIYAVANKSLRRLMTPIALLVTLTVSLQILVWIDSLFGKTTDTTGRVALFAAVVLVVALLWELAASGEGVTNLHSKWFPRDARVMLFGGYILLVSSAVLFYSSLHDAKSQTLLESQFDSEEFVRSGIFFLGVPLVITLCLIGIHRWRESQRQELLDPGPEPSDPALPVVDAGVGSDRSSAEPAPTG
jgi:hypothetical protein